MRIDYGPRMGMNGPRRCRWRDAVVDAGDCPFCKARKGSDCRTATGRMTRLPHMDRRALLPVDWAGVA